MKNRVLKTFSGYIILILIPLGVLLYQGIISLARHKEQIEKNLMTQMQRVSDNSYNHLLGIWNNFIEEEKARPFFHYQAVVIPDEGQFSGTGPAAVQRSPLYAASVEYLGHIQSRSSFTGSRTQSVPPHLDDILRNSLAGYFQYDPSNHTMASPYDPTPAFETPAEEMAPIQAFRQFLVEAVKPRLQERVRTSAGEAPAASDILSQMKVKRVFVSREPLARLNQLRKMAGPVYTEMRETGNPVVEVGYYDFAFLSFVRENTDYVVGYRPVKLDNQILIQGFLFNVYLFLHEAQSYLEPLQPEYGSVVIHEYAAPDHKPLFAPFSALSIGYRTTDQDRYLQNYYGERNRFWFSMIFLIIALGVSLFHLGKLLGAQFRLSRKKNDFISAVTHELKAPLTSIIMYSEMLREGWVRGKEATYYNYIHCESERLSRLIKNVLDYSGIERGSFRPKQSPLELHTFIVDSLTPLRVWFENSSLDLHLHVKAKPTIMSDRDSLSQVIFNLCDNVIKYGKVEGSRPQLHIEIDEDKTFALLTVWDEGPGIPKQDEAKIFQRFYRCENELTRETTGTGLGLSLVKELIEANHGKVALFHPPEYKGFGIRMHLPLAKEPLLTV